MMNCILCIYREWAFDVAQRVIDKFSKDVNFVICVNPESLRYMLDSTSNKLYLIFFIGWSWIVPSEITNEYLCICMHPSDLPKYRGGSPLQHQIINGETESSVTFFVMNEEIDSGPTVCKVKFSLSGSLSEVIKNMAHATTEGLKIVIKECLDNGSIEGLLEFLSLKNSPVLKRRTPEMSEIEKSDFDKFTAKELYNKIRALQDPYPNAFVVCKNNTKLLITDAKIGG